PQQMQPLVRVIISPSRDCTSSASMLIAPKSLTRTARRRPPASRRTRLSSVVLPAPRKPQMTVSEMPGAVAMPRRLVQALRDDAGDAARAAATLGDALAVVVHVQVAERPQQLVALEDVRRVGVAAELLDVRPTER